MCRYFKRFRDHYFPDCRHCASFLAKPDRHFAEGLLTELHAKKVDISLHQQGLDTSTLSGRAMFQMMGVFAEFERALFGSGCWLVWHEPEAHTLNDSSGRLNTI